MNRQNILIIIFIIILAAIGFLWLRYYSAPQPTAETQIRETAVSARLDELRRLKTVELDTSLFRDSFFRSLSFPVPPGGIPAGGGSAPGRANPFLPF